MTKQTSSPTDTASAPPPAAASAAPAGAPTPETANPLRIWKRVELTDPSATKKFDRAGGFKGTGINPTYQYEVITSLFGPCGIGWGYTIVDERLVEGHSRNIYNEKGAQIGCDRTVIHQLRVRFWYIDPETGCEGEIDGFGVTTMIGSNKNGPFTDEEAPKKSLTDALTGCLQKLGVSADIFRGYWDDNKYVAWRMQEEGAGRGTTAQLAGPKISETTRQLAGPAPSGEGQADLEAIQRAHVAWADAHRLKIENAPNWDVLDPLLAEVATRPDTPESLKIMLRGVASAKISVIGPKPKA